MQKISAVSTHFSSLASTFSAVSAGNLSNLRELLQNILIAVPPMGNQTAGAILHAVFRPLAVAAAFAAKRIQRTIAKQAVKILRVCCFMAGKELARRMLYKGIAAFAGLFAKDVVTHFITISFPSTAKPAAAHS